MAGMVDEEKKAKLLVVDDEEGMRLLLKHELNKAGYDVSLAKSIDAANKIIEFMLRKASPFLRDSNYFKACLVDLNVGMESGGEFARRILDIIGDMKVVIVTGYADEAKALPYTPDDLLVKKINERMTASVVADTLKSPRRNSDSPELKLKRWVATCGMRGINSLRKFLDKVDDVASHEVEKITAITMLDELAVNLVVYRQPTVDEDRINIGVSSLIGCPIKCSFCRHWRNRTDRLGIPFEYKRRLSSSEIIGQVYLAMSQSCVVREGLLSVSPKNFVINFTCEGDGLVQNLENCCRAIEALNKINNPQFSFILTSVGSEEALKEYALRYIDLPVTHYWSVNSLDPERRARLMHGTRGQSLENMRNLHEFIANVSGRIVTVSWILIKGVTDREEDAEMIASYFKDRPFQIKLMGLVQNSLQGVQQTSDEDVESFRDKLEALGVSVRVRKVSGSEIYSGCGNTIVEWERK